MNIITRQGRRREGSSADHVHLLIKRERLGAGHKTKISTRRQKYTTKTCQEILRWEGGDDRKKKNREKVEKNKNYRRMGDPVYSWGVRTGMERVSIREKRVGKSLNKNTNTQERKNSV